MTYGFAISSCFCGGRKLGENFFSQAAENGFKAVEIIITPGHFKGTKEEMSLAKRFAAEYGLRVKSIHCDMEILNPPAIEIFKTAKDVILNNLDVTAELGAEHLVIHGYIFADPDNVIVDENGGLHPGLSVFRELRKGKGQMLERVKNGMAEYADEAKKRGVSIALETEAHPCINRMLPELISDADPDACGICFDTGHAQIESDAVSVARAIGSKVICTHIHDNDGKEDLHLPPFKGVIDWQGIVTELTNAGYKGYYTFECKGTMEEIVDARNRIKEFLL